MTKNPSLRGASRRSNPGASETSRMVHQARNGAPDGLMDDRLIEVRPSRIHGLDQSELLFARPGLDLLLAQDRRRHVLVDLVPGEKLAVIFSGEPDLAFPVLPDAPDEIGGDSRVERAIAPADNDVDRRLLHRFDLARSAFPRNDDKEAIPFPSLRGA